jgi:tRNA-specific 2-thiouridylase
MLPLGIKTKKEAREIAHSYSFDNYDRQDSQDLCFLGTLDQETFLALYAQAGLKRGEILNLKGEVIGEHNGLANYTIGQRKGLGAGFKEPMYVLSKDVQRNVLIAGTSRDLGTRVIKIGDVNWISDDEPHLPMECTVKIRYKAAPVKGMIKRGADNKYSFKFNEKVRDATPGQFAVFYDDDLVIGSGEIKEIFGEEI